MSCRPHHEDIQELGRWSCGIVNSQWCRISEGKCGSDVDGKRKADDDWDDETDGEEEDRQVFESMPMKGLIMTTS